MLTANSRPNSDFVKLDISVSIIPGATAFTRMPLGPRIDARCFTIVSRAPFVEAYRGRDGRFSWPGLCRTEWPAIEDRTVTLADDLSVGNSSLTKKNALLTLVENSRSKSASV